VIVSHRHRFIFLRTRKTASTSTELVLAANCGPDDVITGFCDRDEALRPLVGARPPQNLAHPCGFVFYNHAPAEQVRAAVGDCWSSYFTFCFERNPWDKVISLYYHRHKVEPARASTSSSSVAKPSTPATTPCTRSTGNSPSTQWAATSH
jgi:hypothetical protein